MLQVFFLFCKIKKYFIEYIYRAKGVYSEERVLMNFYRVKQFYWSINSKIEEKDKEFIIKHLNKDELKLFCRLSKSEQKHSIKVAYDVGNICRQQNIDSSLLIKAALLHDIGKTVKKLNVVDKSIMVMADNITRGSIKRLSKIKKVNVYYNHGKLGRNILEKYNYDKELLYLIENHHNFKIKGNKELDILRECDDKN